MTTGKMSAQPGFKLFLCNLKHITAVMFPRIASLSFMLFLWILVISALEQYFIYCVGLIPSKFYNLLGTKNFEYFNKELMFSLLFALGIAVVKGVRWFVQQQMYVSCRRLLCYQLHQLYFTHAHYYQLNGMDVTADDRIQQITQDSSMLCTQYSELITAVFILPLVVGVYVYLVYLNLGWFGPVSAVVFVIISKVLSKAVTPPVVDSSIQHEITEDSFRQFHLKVQVHAESLAFHNSDQLECAIANKKLARVTDAQQKLYHWQLLLNIVINSFDYLGSIMSYVVLFVPIYFGRYDYMDPVQISVLISQNAFFFIYLISVVNSFFLVWEKMMDMAINCHHVVGLITKLVEMKKLNSMQFDLHESFRTTEPGWVLENVTIVDPHSNCVILQDLSLRVVPGENVLIVGSKSSGKTSLLRILRGLWAPSSGNVKRNLQSGMSSVIFLPQVPVFTSGCLKEQITYPKRTARGFDEEPLLIELLHLADLEGLLFRTGGLEAPGHWNWEECLSRSEQQALCFLRALYHRPKFLVADQATDALLQSVEDALLQRSQELGISLIMTADNTNRLARFYHKVLVLEGTGGWTLQENEFSA